MQVFVFRRLEGDELRQTLVTLGISIVAADLMLAIWTGITYQIGVPAWLDGAVKLPIVTAVRSNGTAVMMTYPFYRLVVLGTAIVIGVGLWLMISRTRIGMMIRAGVDDRSMLSASGINVHVVFAIVFAVGAGLAGFAGVVGGSALSLAPGEDVRYLLASLVVVIVGGMGSIPGAAIGALLVGFAEQIGLVYLPTYGIVLTFVIMVVALALRPQGIMGTTRTSATPVLALDQPSRAAVVPARFGPAQIALAAALLLYPAVASEFFVAQIGAYSLIWGLLALSMMLLAGYGGMVSLAQITTAGVAAYTVAIFGTNNMNIHGFGWPWWVLVPFAVLLAGTVSALIGAISVRTEGIYTIMITLAIAAAFFYFAQQNYALFNGHSGYAGIPTPRAFGIDWRDPVPFYYLCLLVAAACYAAVLYCSRSTFGLALQAIRDNGRRMRAVGFNVTAHKVVAYFYSGVIAGLAGVLLVWFNGRVSPGTVDVGQAIEVLVIAVIGGLRHPIGPFVGAAFVILIQTFAIDIVGAERYNTLIGLVFLAIVFVSPDGLLGLWGRLKPLLAAAVLALPRVGGSVTSSTNRIKPREDRMSVNRRLLLGLGLAAGLTVPSAAMAQDSIKIGVLATFEGAFAILGDDSMRGALMAVDDFGGKVGGKKIEIVKGSSDGSPDSAVRAVRKLVEQDGVKVLVGPLSGDEGLAVKDYAKTKPDVTIVNGTSAAQDTTLRDPAPNFFRFSTDGAQWMAGLGDYAYNTKKYKKVATLAEDYSFPYTQVFGFMAPFCKAGGHVVKKFWVPIGTKDFASVIAAMPDSIDAIYVVLGGSDSVNFLTQYKQAGGQAPLIGGSVTVDQTILGSKGKTHDVVIGTPSAGPIADDNNYAGMEEVRRGLQEGAERLPVARRCSLTATT